MKACHICISTFEDSVRFCPFHGVELRSVPGRLVLPGESLGDYTLITKLGQDGLGEVFRAVRDGVQYRYRLFSPGIFLDDNRRTLFLELLELNRSFTGGGVPVVDYGWHDETQLYSAHPFIPGRSLHDIFQSDQLLSQDDVADVLYQLLRAIRDIHEQGVVHGNLTLSNIIIDTNGQIRIHDVGFWEVLRGEHFLDLREDNVGIFADIIDMMSPEVARGEESHSYSDVYSAGAAALLLLTREYPSSLSLEEKMHQRIVDEANDLDKLSFVVDVKTSFLELIEAAMLGDSGLRFQTPRAFITALLSIHQELDAHATSLSPELRQRILDKSQKHARAAQLDAIDVNRLLREETVISNTQVGMGKTRDVVSQEDPERIEKTVIERTHWEDLDVLVGVDLPDIEGGDVLERAVTTQLEPFEAMPTQEMKASAFEAPGQEISLSQQIGGLLDDDESDSDFERYDSVPSLGSLSLDLDRVEAEVDDKAELVDDAAAKTVADDPVVVDASEQSDVSEALAASKDAEASTLEDAEASTLDEKSTNFLTSSLNKANAAITEALARAQDKPQNRMSRKSKSKDDGAELQDGDVVAISDSNEPRKARRKRLRDASDVEPKEEVVTVDVEIAPMKDGAKRSSFSKLPKMTQTNGYKLDASDEADIDVQFEPDDQVPVKAKAKAKTSLASSTKADKASSEAVSKPAKSDVEIHDIDDSEDDWFGRGDDGESRDARGKTVLIAIIGILVLAIVVVASIMFYNSLHDKLEQSAVASIEAKIEAFYQHVEEDSREDRDIATRLLTEIQGGDVEQNRIQQCRLAYVKSLQSQIEQRYKYARLSENILDSSDLALVEAAASAHETLCQSELLAAEGDVSRHCALERAYADGLYQSAAMSGAYSSYEELQEQHERWLEIEEVYTLLSKQSRKQQIDDFDARFDEAKTQRVLYAAKLEKLAPPEKQVQEKLQASEVLEPQVPSQDAVVDEVLPPPSVLDTQPAVADPVLRQEVVERPIAVAPVVVPVVPVADNQQPSVKTPEAETTVDDQLRPKDPTSIDALFPNEGVETDRRKLLIDDEDIPEKTPVKEPAVDAPKAPVKEPAVDAAPVEDKTPAAVVPTAKLLADAQSAMSKGNHESAASLIAQALKQDPKNHRALFVKARIYDAKGDYDVATASAKVSCSLSKQASCYSYLGDLYKKQGNTKEARKAYDNALDMGASIESIDNKLKDL